MQRVWRWDGDVRPPKTVIGSLVAGALKTHRGKPYIAGKSYSIAELLDINGVTVEKKGFFDRILRLRP